MLVDHLRPTTLTLDEILEGLRALRSKSRPVRRVERGGDWAQVAACKLLAAEDETRRQLWSCQKEVAETGVVSLRSPIADVYINGYMNTN